MVVGVLLELKERAVHAARHPSAVGPTTSRTSPVGSAEAKLSARTPLNLDQQAFPSSVRRTTRGRLGAGARRCEPCWFMQMLSTERWAPVTVTYRIDTRVERSRIAP
jgi:hypothetical protein